LCVIVFKPQLHNLPQKKLLKRCFKENQDGIGFAYNKDGHNIINKGFFDFDDFYSALAKEVDYYTPAIIHFRFKSHGNISAENCHPFPITGDAELLRKTDVETKEVVMAHNGVLSVGATTNRGMSDTMIFIKDILSEGLIKDNIFSEDAPVLFLIRKAIGSDRMIFMNNSGRSLLLGDFEKDKGVYYSNDDYKYVEEVKAKDRKIIDIEEDSIIKHWCHQHSKYGIFTQECYKCVWFDTCFNDEEIKVMKQTKCDNCGLEKIGIDWDLDSEMFLCKECKILLMMN
jgi:hypothetical protein